LREKRADELKKWGFEQGHSTDQAAFAEACAEAASPLDRVIPVSSLAHRRFRTEFIEPLLAAPKMNGKSKGKHKIPKGSAPSRPKGRLARAVKELLESDTIDEVTRSYLISGLSKALQTVGIRSDNPLRKKIDKHCTSLPQPARSAVHTPC
jgi:hypothetical protein